MKMYQASSEHVYHKSALINLRPFHRMFLKVFEGAGYDRSIIYPKTKEEALDWLAEDDNFFEISKTIKFD